MVSTVNVISTYRLVLNVVAKLLSRVPVVIHVGSLSDLVLEVVQEDVGVRVDHRLVRLDSGGVAHVAHLHFQTAHDTVVVLELAFWKRAIN